MDIFRKIGAVITSGVMAFILVAENTSQINTVSADNPDIPQLKSIDLDGFYGSNPYRYTGVLQKVMNIDIDYDGEKEVIAYYKGGCLENSEKTNIDAFYDIYDENSDTPQTVCKERISIHSHYETHIIKDNNNGKIFLGYITDDPSMAGLCTLYPVRESIMRLDEELYDSYMKNVTFLDEVAYGKGDIDGDADITISDASTILSCYAYNLAGLPLEINDIQKDAADMDKDGEITISDTSTALSLYAESAAGLIDTLLLPSIMKEDTFPINIESNIVRDGKFESIFYLDIDNDGKKETIGRYDNTSLSSSVIQADPYVLQVYDNGNFCDTFGFNPGVGMTRCSYVLVKDNNINETYLASVLDRCAAMYGYAVMSKEYPIVVGEAQPYILYINDTVNMESGEPVTTETIEIDSKSATRQEILDYINNLEIINPYKNEDESLSIFEYIFDTYSE